MTRLTSSFEMMLGAANGMRVEFSAVAFVGCSSRCGFRRSGCHYTDVVDWIGITVPGIVFLSVACGCRYRCIVLVCSFDLWMWSLVELWTSSDLVSHPMKLAFPPPSDLIKHVFMWKF